MLEYRGHDGSNFQDKAHAPRGSRNLDFCVNIHGAGESSAAKSKNADQGNDRRYPLSQNAKAETYFRKMAPSHRKAYVQWIEQAKKAETRESRLKKAIHMLLQGKALS